MDNLQHKGTIIGIEGRLIDVRMTVEGACGSCRAKELCGAGESADKVVTVLSDMAEYYSVGEEVMVSVTRMMGVRAVIYAYAVPFIIILATLLILLGSETGETVAGLGALGAGALYYIILWFFRDRIEKEIVFKINKI